MASKTNRSARDEIAQYERMATQKAKTLAPRLPVEEYLKNLKP